MNMNLPAFGIKIELIGPKGQAFGTLSSAMHENGESPELKASIDGIERLILAHACAGVDVMSPAYIEGIETSVLTIMNQHA
jgi:hypothetical protein